jgi:hypothetical protein
MTTNPKITTTTRETSSWSPYARVKGNRYSISAGLIISMPNNHCSKLRTRNSPKLKARMSPKAINSTYSTKSSNLKSDSKNNTIKAHEEGSF